MMTYASNKGESSSIKDVILSFLSKKSTKCSAPVQDKDVDNFFTSDKVTPEYAIDASMTFKRNYSDDSLYDSTMDDTDTTLWANESNQWSEKLSEKIRTELKKSILLLDLNLQLPNDFLTRLSREIVATSLREPCGIRGCSVQLRLLHEDVANILMTCSNQSRKTNHSGRCVSWPEVPKDFQTNTRSTSLLDFKYLADMDVKLIRKYSPDTYSTDSGFCEVPSTKRPLKSSLSDASTSFLPKLSAASNISVPCADLGHVEFDPNTVPNFEIYVYLAPATSWSWKVRKFFASTLSMDETSRPRTNSVGSRRRQVILVPDFTLVKRKLFRSRSNSMEVIRCSATNQS